MRHHRPTRTCIGCGAKRQKSEMLRLVRTPQGELGVDVQAKCPGRGAYLCFAPKCVEKAIKERRIQRSLRVVPEAVLYDELRKITQTSQD